MSDPLRDRQLPRELAEHEQVIEFSEKIGGLKSLARVIEQDLSALDASEVPAQWREAIVSGRLQFGFVAAQAEQTTLTGQLDASIAAVCQRCLAPLELPLSVPLRLALIPAGGKAAQVDGYEDWELSGVTVCPIEVVEEALLMALPLSTMHPTGCTEISVESDTAELTTPFASLRRQMDED